VQSNFMLLLYVTAHVCQEENKTILLTFPERSRIVIFMATKRKDPYAVALGRRGGLKGGPARAAKLTPEQRSESARKAVKARWEKVKKKQ
jgi:hypothetical protein